MVQYLLIVYEIFIERRIEEKMANKFNNKIENKIENLSELVLTDEEMRDTVASIKEMLDYVDVLRDIDTNQVEPLFQVNENILTFREDKIVNGDGRKIVLENAPERKDNYIVVPKTFD